MRYEDDEIFFLFFCSKYFTVTLSGLAWGCDNKIMSDVGNKLCMSQCVYLDRKKRGSSVANFTLTLNKFNFILFIFFILKLNGYGVYVFNMLLNCSYELHCYEAQQFRSSHRRCSVRKGVLKNFAKFTAKHLYQSLIFNKAAGLRPPTLLKKRL